MFMVLSCHYCNFLNFSGILRDKDTRLLSFVYCFTSHLIFEYSQDQVEGKKSSHVMRFEQQNTIQSNKWETDTNNMISAVFPVVPCRSFVKLPFSLLMPPTSYIYLFCKLVDGWKILHF